MTAPPAPARDGAPLARALLDRALATFRVVPDRHRGPALAAIDQFLAAPAPAAYVAATRALRSVRHEARMAGAAGTIQRSFDEAAAALRGAVPTLADRIIGDLPVDARAAQRLHALAALATAYEELSSRVAADSDEMRRRLRAGAPRRSYTRR